MSSGHVKSTLKLRVTPVVALLLDRFHGLLDTVFRPRRGTLRAEPIFVVVIVIYIV